MSVRLCFSPDIFLNSIFDVRHKFIELISETILVAMSGAKSIETVMEVLKQLREKKRELEQRQADCAREQQHLDWEASQGRARLARELGRREKHQQEFGAVRVRVAARQTGLEVVQRKEEEARGRIQRMKVSAEGEVKERSKNLYTYEREMGKLTGQLGREMVGRSSLAKVERRTEDVRREREQVEMKISQLRLDE